MPGRSRPGLVYVIGIGAQAATVFVSTPWLTRAMPPSNFGTIAYGLAVSAILNIVLSLGMKAAVTRGFFEESGRVGRARRLAVAAVAISTVLGAITYVLSLSVPVHIAGFSARSTIALVLAYSWLASISTSATAVLRAQGRATSYVAATFAAGAGAQVLGLIAVLVLEPSPSAYFAGMTAGAGLAVAIGWSRVGLVFELPDRAELRWSMRLALPALPHTIGMYLLDVGDRFVLNNVLGADAVGRYQIAYLAGSGGILILAALNNHWAPSVFGAPLGERWAFLRGSTIRYVRLAAFLSLTTSLFAPIALGVLAPPEYELDELVTLTALVGLASLFYVRYLSRVHVLFQMSQVKPLALISPAVAVGNVIVNILLVPHVGLIGAALATVAAYQAQAYLVGRSARRLVTGIDVPLDLRAWAIALLGLGCAVLLPSTGAWWFIGRVLVALIGAFVLRLGLPEPGEPRVAPATSPTGGTSADS